MQCIPKECSECSESQSFHVNQNCECICKDCNNGEKLCPTTGKCLQESLWCDGIDHCSDDERDCDKVTIRPEDQRFSFKGELCPSPQCNPGTRPVETEVETLDGCPYYKCVTIVVTTTPTPEDSCPTPECPPGYTPKMINFAGMKLTMNNTREKRYAVADVDANCPKYECVPIIEVDIESPSTCSVEEEQITTFDGMVYNGELCHHHVLKDKFGEIAVDCKFTII